MRCVVDVFTLKTVSIFLSSTSFCPSFKTIHGAVIFRGHTLTSLNEDVRVCLWYT